MRSPAWALADHQRLAEMFDAGATDAAIAAALGRTERGVVNKRHDLGLRRYSRDTRLAAGESVLAQRYRIAMDALDDCELQGKLSANREIVETVAIARRRIDRCEHSPPSP
ncbi:MAG: hypothetical protein QG587_1096 [Chloroflexota bacterium]|nr:hypothetical protein [Chloroflexota bacterium]